MIWLTDEDIRLLKEMEAMISKPARAKEVGLRAVIMCASSKSNTLGIDEIRLRLGDEGIHDIRAGRPASPVSALALESGFIPVGRATSIPEEERLIGMFRITCSMPSSPSSTQIPSTSSADMASGAILTVPRMVFSMSS